MIDKKKFLGVLKKKLKDLVQRKVQDGDESGLARHRQVILASVVIMQEFCNGILFPALEVIVEEINKNEKDLAFYKKFYRIYKDYVNTNKSLYYVKENIEKIMISHSTTDSGFYIGGESFKSSFFLAKGKEKEFFDHIFFSKEEAENFIQKTL